MMHALKKFYHLCIYKYAHNHKMPEDSNIYYSNKLWFIVTVNVSIMWHEATYHNGSKSRPDPDNDSVSMEDLRLFFYMWLELKYNKGTARKPQNNGTTDGFSREFWRDLYRGNSLHSRTCKHISLEVSPCEKFSKGTETIIILQIIKDHQFDQSETPNKTIIYMVWRMLEKDWVISKERDSRSPGVFFNWLNSPGSSNSDTCALTRIKPPPLSSNPLFLILSLKRVSQGIQMCCLFSLCWRYWRELQQPQWSPWPLWYRFQERAWLM